MSLYLIEFHFFLIFKKSLFIYIPYKLVTVNNLTIVILGGLSPHAVARANRLAILRAKRCKPFRSHTPQGKHETGLLISMFSLL